MVGLNFSRPVKKKSLLIFTTVDRKHKILKSDMLSEIQDIMEHI